MLVRRCDFCGKIDEEGDWDLAHSQYCEQCEEKFRLMKNEAFEAMKHTFGAHVAAQISVINLLQHIKNHRAEEFEDHFGASGVDLLQKALADIHGNKG